MSGGGFDPGVVRSAYASAARDYAATFGDDLAKLELDRRVLDVIVDRSPRLGPVLDLGCGPAHLAAYVRDHGAAVFGVDFTTAMLNVARTRVPGLQVVAADLRALPIRSGAAGGIVAFYALQHVRREDFAESLAELRRSLMRDGLLALALHEGDGEFRVGEVTATRYRADEVVDHVADTGFIVETIEHRDPLPNERQEARVYLTGRAV